jgi:hypothetical protein
MNAATAGAVWLVMQCISSPRQEMKCDFIHVQDPAALSESAEWRVGPGGPFGTEDECRRVRIKFADRHEPKSEIRRELEAKGYAYSFWCIPYARDAVPHEFAKEPPLYKTPQPPLNSGLPPTQPPWKH